MGARDDPGEAVIEARRQLHLAFDRLIGAGANGRIDIHDELCRLIASAGFCDVLEVRMRLEAIDDEDGVDFLDEEPPALADVVPFKRRGA